MTWRLSRFRVGDLVEVRGKEEILATLDENGCVEGMPFMPEMLQYCGKRFRVGAVAHKTCDTVRKTWKLRRLQTAVHLEGLRCDGLAHGECQAECNLFWKDVWLQPAGVPGDGSTKSAAPARCPLAAICTENRLRLNTRLPSATKEDPCYTCQATKLYEATEPLPWWDLRQHVFDVATGNHTVGRVVRVLWLGLLRWSLQHVPRGYRVAKGFSEIGFELCATSGTAKILQENGIKVQFLFKLTEGRPNVLDMIKNGEVNLIINTPAGQTPRADEVQIRAAAVTHKIAIMTTLAGANAALLGIKAFREKGLTVCSLQEYHTALRGA